jgi:two-component system chemotaxis response regulator CheB
LAQRHHALPVIVVANWKGRCVAILVSGLHTDGVAALRGARESGGLCIVQDPATGSVSEIPENGIKSGFGNFVLSAGDIGRELSRIVRL